MQRHISTLILAGLLAPASVADDFYVDAINGSDGANGGLGDPWRTLTHALAQVPTGDQTIYVASGNYDAANGEQFPIELRPGQTIQGTGDAIVTSHGNLNAFYLQPGTIWDTVELNTLRLRGTHGLGVYTTWGDFATSVVLRNLDVSLSGRLVNAESSGAIAGGGPITLENVHVHDGGGLIWLNQWDCANTFSIHATDCTFERLDEGVNESNSANIPSAMTFTRCRFSDIQWDVINADYTNLTMESCLIEGGRDAVNINSSYVWGSATIRHSTLVNNSGVGVVNGGSTTSILDSIVWGNADDIGLIPGTLNIQSSNIGDGTGAGQNGTISADPLFRDANAGDYRLMFGSPSVDAGVLAGTDLDGFPFDTDGDLDTDPQPDMGAYELRTLFAPNKARIGSKLHLDAAGATDQYTAFFLGRTEPMVTPDVTPFGRRWIPENQLELIGTHKILSPHGVRHTVYLPNSQPLVGLTFSFQAMTRSAAAPSGAAWSDVAAVQFMP